MKSLKKGIKRQALRRSSLCLRHFSTSSLSLTLPTSLLSWSSNSLSAASSCSITSAILITTLSAMPVSQLTVLTPAGGARPRRAEAVDSHLSAIHAERIQISLATQHLPISCLSTYIEHTGTYLVCTGSRNVCTMYVLVHTEYILTTYSFVPDYQCRAHAYPHWQSCSPSPPGGQVLVRTGMKWVHTSKYLNVQVHSLYALQSNQFVPVFQGMLVQDKFRCCKPLLLLLCHRLDKTARVSLLDIITHVIVLICRWLLCIWHQHVCITLHSSKSCQAGLRTSKYHEHNC
jgi:hypothetical protein